MRLKKDFFERPALVVAKELLGKTIVRKVNGKTIKAVITETEAYIGEKDLASHARFGPTNRNRIMYGPGGFWYVYLIYGMYWLLNVVVESEGFPVAVLIRCGVLKDGTNLNGPGKLTRSLLITKEFNGLNALKGDLYLEDAGVIVKKVKRMPRVGIDYAGKYKDKPWRFILSE